jgi:hypothetical protein
VEFNIFINDILDGCDRLGVIVPGLNRRVPGLLFADDLVLISSTRRKLQLMLGKLDSWAGVNEMGFGISKCGVMAVGKLPEQNINRRLRTYPGGWFLGGQEIPIVDSYTYLGLTFTSDMDLGKMANDRAIKGLKAFYEIKPLLECYRIPMLIRVRMIKAMLIPVLTYGGELWGMSDQRAHKVQQVLNLALRSLLRMGERSTLVSNGVLGLEFGIPPVTAMVSAARARGFTKYHRLRTLISLLVQSPVSSRNAKHTWVTGSRRWLKRFCPDVLTAHVPGQAAEQAAALTPTGVSIRVKKTVWARVNRSSGSSTARIYGEGGYDVTSGYLWEALQYPLEPLGIHWLTKARVNALWTARSYARIRWLPEEYRTRCPFCNLGDHGETLGHLLVECPRWDEQRREIQFMVDEAREQLGPETDSRVIATYLLGGRCLRGDREAHIRCIDWVRVERELRREGNDDGRAFDDRTAGFILVARFFKAVMPARFSVLGPLLKPPRADAE